MKSVLLSAIFSLLMAFCAQAQTQGQMNAPRPMLRPSSKGRVMATSPNKNVTVTYGQPALNGKEALGMNGAVKYGDLWQTGINGPTEISFARGVLFDGREIKPGKYTLYTVPGSSDWIVMLNTKAGLTDYNKAKATSVATVKRRAKVVNTAADKLLITPTDSALFIMWGELSVMVPMK
jgi:Protein of unknown function (DUF2911)